MDQARSGGSTLFRSSSSTGSASNRWKPTEEQKRILESIYMSGTRNPLIEQMKEITTNLQHFGWVERKNVVHWFQMSNGREQSHTKSFKWCALLNPTKWSSLFRSKRSSGKGSADKKEISIQIRRNSSADPSDL